MWVLMITPQIHPLNKKKEEEEEEEAEAEEAEEEGGLSHHN